MKDIIRPVQRKKWFRLRLIHMSRTSWKRRALWSKAGYARTYHKGAWAALNDRGAANKNFIVEDENYGYFRGWKQLQQRV